MTFSLVARDARTGSFGIVISSSSPAVASRCAHLKAGVGACASQNVTHPGLGDVVLAALAEGRSATEAVAIARESDHFAEFRQLTAVDAAGGVAVHSGRRALGTFGSFAGEGALAAGNMLASLAVLEGMVGAFSASSATFEERLLAAYRAGVAAGGEEGPVRSAGLAVVDAASWRTTDLRVDDHDDPLAELSRLVDIWLPQKADYLTRALSPEAAPSYGVPGDL